jgi:predicted PurR-regulated permease PerM
MKTPKWYVVVPILIVVALIVWYFSAIITYILVAAVLSIMGHPLVKFLGKLKLGKLKIPNSLCALITLFFMMFVVFSVFRLIIPMVASQADSLSGVNVATISKSFKEPLLYLQSTLTEYNLIEPGQNIEKNISDQFFSIVGVAQFSNVINSLVSFAGNVFIAVFAITFITFYFLKDEHLFFKIVMIVTPQIYQNEVRHVMLETKRLLTRYFIGLCLEITIVIILITIGIWSIGIKNALLIGLFAGILNIIPYVGPLIGAVIGILLGLSGNLDMDFSTQMVPLIFKMLGIFFAIKLIDDMILQPNIYSKSVKAHPLEIFLVIMMAASIAGVPGMMLAIPSYTVLRIIAKEFFNKFYFVKRLTEEIDK